MFKDCRAEKSGRIAALFVWKYEPRAYFGLGFGLIREIVEMI
jgi:hypothetical protein